MKIVRKMNSYDGKEWMWLEKNDGKEYPYPIHIIENVQYETLLYKKVEVKMKRNNQILLYYAWLNSNDDFYIEPYNFTQPDRNGNFSSYIIGNKGRRYCVLLDCNGDIIYRDKVDIYDDKDVEILPNGFYMFWYSWDRAIPNKDYVDYYIINIVDNSGQVMDTRKYPSYECLSTLKYVGEDLYFSNAVGNGVFFDKYLKKIFELGENLKLVDNFNPMTNLAPIHIENYDRKLMFKIDNNKILYFFDCSTMSEDELSAVCLGVDREIINRLSSLEHLSVFSGLPSKGSIWFLGRRFLSNGHFFMCYDYKRQLYLVFNSYGLEILKIRTVEKASINFLFDTKIVCVQIAYYSPRNYSAFSLYDYKGKLLDSDYEYISSFVNHRALFKKGTKKGIIECNNEEIIEYEFPEEFYIYNFEEYLQYPDLKLVEDGIAIRKNGWHWDFYNLNFEFVQTYYSDIVSHRKRSFCLNNYEDITWSCFCNKFYCAYYTPKGYINKKGKIVKYPDINDLSVFIEKNAN